MPSIVATMRRQQAILSPADATVCTVRTPSRPLLAALALALAAGVASSPVSAAHAGEAAGTVVTAASAAEGPDPYFPEDGNRGIDVLRYRIADAYDFTSGQLTGHTTLRIRATAPLSVFDLDLLLPVTAVSLDGRDVPFTKPDARELQIVPPATIAEGTTFTASVSYAGTPGDICWQGECNWLADSHEVTTINEPHMAAWWFPANDTPADAAKMDISITVPAAMRVIANGRQVSRTVAGGLATTRWKARDPMAPYLAYFTAGDYTVRKGRSHGLPWLVAVSDQLPSGSRTSALRLMRRTPTITAWLSSKIGSYPFDTVGGVTTSLDPGFALETQTRPVYPVLRSERVVTVVHELAHQWFGDSVRLARWRDLWLNEGFATFFEWYWTETHGGPPAEEHLLDDYAQEPSAFWRTRTDDPGAGHLWDDQVYERGAMTLQALRTRVGDTTFWRILRGWARTRAGRTATTAQFEAYAARVSGESLAAFFRAWLDTPSRPAMTGGNGLAAPE